MQVIKKYFYIMNLNFFYFIPIVLFGSIYLIKLSKNIIKLSFENDEKKA